jgi:hypothetical protein
MPWPDDVLDTWTPDDLAEYARWKRAVRICYACIVLIGLAGFAAYCFTTSGPAPASAVVTASAPK